MWVQQECLEIDTVSVLGADGKMESRQLDVTANDDQIIEMYEQMVRARTFDDIALKFQRQGKIGTYAPVRGQEAAQVGSAFALRKQDWIYPSYREVAASLVHGMPMHQFFCYTMGKMAGQHMTGLNIFPIQIIIGAQLLHATGGAWSSQYKKEDSVSVAYMGDGGTSEGDFHEALNFAGVYKLPVIYFIQNNQWAISVPIHRQTASHSIAQKALAYGITGIQVDGNDVVAVYEVMKLAIEKARKGEPVLIEAVTFRQGPHTTADDPTKYREAAEVQRWLKKDPIERVKAYLINQSIWSEEKDQVLTKQCENEVFQAYEKAIATESTTLEKAFHATYAALTPSLQFSKRGVRK